MAPSAPQHRDSKFRAPTSASPWRAAGARVTLAGALLVCVALHNASAAPQLPQSSADGVWTSMTASPGAIPLPDLVLAEHHALTLDAAALAELLATAPREREREAADNWPIVLIPMPDGSFARFAFVEAPIMHPDLAAAFPEIRTYLGRGLDDPRASVRFDLTPAGFHAQVLSPTGAVYVDPLARGDRLHHASYDKRDFRSLLDDFTCHVLDVVANLDRNPTEFAADARAGGQLRTYRLAVAATQEYTDYHGDTVPAAMSAIVTAINRVNGIYETELGVRLELIAGNDLLVYTSEPDPYTNGNSSALIAENQANIDAVIGSGNYDIGHVFATSGGGRAALASVCVAGQKAQGATGRFPPTGDAYWVDYVAHEIGHQFSAQHTFNSVTGSCGSAGQRVASSAYEPGSGSTIMAYAGICGSDNLQSHSDPYFHHESIRQISSFITSGSGAACPTVTATGNNDPSIDAGSNYFIPRLTPFTLTAAASDSDGDALTYSWEERDLGPAAAVIDPDNGFSPLFRVWPPTPDPARTLPRLGELLNNNAPFGEKLPSVSRILNFRVTARDNRAGGGGVAHDDMLITVDDSIGPFQVTSPNAGTEVWTDGGTVTWNVAGTDAGSVSCATVDILLSTNGGWTYPITLAAGTPNDGLEVVSVAVAPTTQARVKVAAVGNIFFDISNANFTIDSPALVITLPAGAPAALVPGIPTPLAVEISPLAETLMPGSALLHYRGDGGPFTAIPLTAQGGNLFEVRLPRATCSDTPEYYLSAMGHLGTLVTYPADAPTNSLVSTVGVIAVVFADDFETDLGWTVSASSSSVQGLWERGIPMNGNRGDPPADFDGSGQCYLTDNTNIYPNSDIDNGTTTVTSPPIDLSAGGTISYALWFNDDPSNPLGPEDNFDVEYATDPAGASWQLIRTYNGALAAWRPDSIAVGVETPASATFRIRFTAKDIPPGDIVEAGLDAVSVAAFTCYAVGSGDFDDDGDIDLVDFAAAQVCWTEIGVSPECAQGDLDGNSVLDGVDLEILTQILTGP